MQLVFLPATAPDDVTYGVVPDRIEAMPDAAVHAVTYPNLVWYNEDVCGEAIRQIRSLDRDDLVLIGFSKSGLGALNIARQLPDVIAATMIFDSPTCCPLLPPWGTAPFYANDAEWQRDLPLNRIPDFTSAVRDNHQLVLISGPGFRDDMQQFSDTLNTKGYGHVFINCQHMVHHWNSGWIEEGLRHLKIVTEDGDGER